MLKKIAKKKKDSPHLDGARFAIVAARYNPSYTDALVKFALKEFDSQDVTDVDVVRVPGAFEIPVIAGHLARSIQRYDAIICFGAILQGATSHADQIALGVTHALAQLQVDGGVPIIHGVLSFGDEEQAKVRCLRPEHNRGTEAARTAMEMARLMRTEIALKAFNDVPF